MNAIEVKDGRPPFVRVDHWVVELLPVIGVTAFAVYAVLAKYASQETAQCYPSRKTIARDAGVSERSVDGALATLREHKVISATRRSVGLTAMRTSNLYTLLDRPREVGQILPSDAQNLRTLSAESAGGVGQNLRLGGAESAQELEPKNNNHKEQEQVKIPPSPIAPRSRLASSASTGRDPVGDKPSKPRTAPKTPRVYEPKPEYDAFKATFPTVHPSVAGEFNRFCLVEGLTADDWRAFIGKQTQALMDGFLTAHNAPARFKAWATSGPGRRTARQTAVTPPGAPENWRDVLFAPDGSRRAPQFVLRRLGMEEHTPPEQYPAWLTAVMA